jgi:hypothetical protein
VLAPKEEQFEGVWIKGAEKNVSTQEGGHNNTMRYITRNFIISTIY